MVGIVFEIDNYYRGIKRGPLFDGVIFHHRAGCNIPDYYLEWYHGQIVSQQGGVINFPDEVCFNAVFLEEPEEKC